MLNGHFNFRGICRLNMDHLKTRLLSFFSLFFFIAGFDYVILQYMMFKKQMLKGFTDLNLRERLHVITDPSGMSCV